MSVRDVAFRVSVDGADSGTAKLKGVSTAIDGVSAAAAKNAASTSGMAKGFGSVEAGLEKVTGPAGKALRVLNDVGDVFRLMGAGLAGGALFGGLQDIAEALKLMYAAAERALDPNLWAQAQGIIAYEKAIEDAAKAATKAIQEQQRAQEQAGASAGERAIEVLGSGADPAAVARALNVGRQLEELLQQRRRILDSVASYSGNAMVSQSLLDVQASIEARRKELRGLTEVGQSAPAVKASAPRAVARYAPWDIAGMLEEGSFAAVSASDDFLTRFQPMDTSADDAIVRDQRNAMMAGHGSPESMGPEAVPPSLLASLTASDDERQRFEADMATASKAVQRQTAQTLKAADAGAAMFEEFAHGSATSAAAALYMGESFTVATNLALQALAVRAGGEAIWETAQGIGQMARYIASFGLNAAALTSASTHFSSAAMYATISGGAALGAVATGGFGSGGGAGGVGSGGHSGPSGGMSNPGRGGSDGGTVVMVHIGGELVTRGVTSETRKQELRGGLSESKLRRAS